MQQTVSPVLGSREEKRIFYKRTLRTTLPIALQNLMDAAVNSADVLMLSFVSQSALAASSLAGQIAFVLFNLLFGISSGAAVMAAQYWGKGDRRTVEKVLGLSLRTALLVSSVFTLAALVIPETLMRIFTDDPALIAEGIIYLRAVSASYMLSAFASVYLGVMRSVERVKESAAIHISAVIMNVFFNACFIFGWGPFPKLGIFGVGLATSITRAIEVVLCLWDSVRCRTLRLKLRDLFSRSASLMHDFIRFAVPAAANDIIWGLAFSVYSIILGHLSSDIVAANSVASVVRNLGMAFCSGTAASASIILGQSMGCNRLQEARAYASRFVKLAIWTALGGGVIILLLRPVILDFMHLYVTVTDVVKSELSVMLFINAYYILGMSLNTMFICGIFRAGGDVRYGLLCAFVFRLPELWVYFILCLDEFVKVPVNMWHYKQRKWLRNITREQAE